MTCFLTFLALAGLIGITTYFISTHNQLIKAENEVERQYTNLSYMHSSAQDLLNDFIVSISTYGHDEEKAMDRYYSMVENMVSSGFGQSNLISPAGSPPTSPPTRLAELYQTRMQEVARLREQFNSQLDSYTLAISNYKTVRMEFPACMIPDALLGQSKIAPLLSVQSIQFIDVEYTRNLIDKQRQSLSENTLS